MSVLCDKIVWMVIWAKCVHNTFGHNVVIMFGHKMLSFPITFMVIISNKLLLTTVRACVCMCVSVRGWKYRKKITKLTIVSLSGEQLILCTVDNQLNRIIWYLNIYIMKCIWFCTVEFVTITLSFFTLEWMWWKVKVKSQTNISGVSHDL